MVLQMPLILSWIIMILLNILEDKSALPDSVLGFTYHPVYVRRHLVTLFRKKRIVLMNLSDLPYGKHLIKTILFYLFSFSFNSLASFDSIAAFLSI